MRRSTRAPGGPLLHWTTRRAVISSVCLCGLATVTEAQRLMDTGRHDLTTRWELSDSLRGPVFQITPFKPVYFLPAVWSSSPNFQPTREKSPPDEVVDSIPLNAVEFKFQLSLKVKLAQGLFRGKGDLWLGYTQTSRWQLYNAALSRPFRETNYEPEVMISVPTNYRVLGFTGRLFTLGFVHQSNGRADPLSRSWNRVVAQIGLDRGPTTLLLRPWWRIPEDADVDENPDIENYLGSGEFLLIHGHDRHLFTLQFRPSLLDDPFLGGSVMGEWTYQIAGNLKAYLQVFHGYGESMLDYNHEQTTIGVGFTLLEWM